MGSVAVKVRIKRCDRGDAVFGCDDVIVCVSVSLHPERNLCSLSNFSKAKSSRLVDGLSFP